MHSISLTHPACSPNILSPPKLIFLLHFLGVIYFPQLYPQYPLVTQQPFWIGNTVPGATQLCRTVEHQKTQTDDIKWNIYHINILKTATLTLFSVFYSVCESTAFTRLHTVWIFVYYPVRQKRSACSPHIEILE